MLDAALCWVRMISVPYHQCITGGILRQIAVVHSHSDNPRPANAAALLMHEDAATSAAGGLDADSNGSDPTAD